MFVQGSLILETSITLRIRTLELLLIYQVHGAGAQQHGAAPADVCLVCLKHHIGAASVSEHHLAGEPFDQYLGDVLSASPSYQLFLWNALAY